VVERRLHNRIDRRLFGRSYDWLHELKDSWFMFRGVFHRELFHDADFHDPEFALMVYLATNDEMAMLSSLFHDMVDRIATKIKIGEPLSIEEQLFLTLLGLDQDLNLSRTGTMLLLGASYEGRKVSPDKRVKRIKGKKAKHKDSWDDH